MAFHPRFIDVFREAAEDFTFSSISESEKGRNALAPLVDHYGPSMPNLAKRLSVGLSALDRVEAAGLEFNGWMTANVPSRGQEPDALFAAVDANGDRTISLEEWRRFQGKAQEPRGLHGGFQ
jgi:hypothetical protein